MSFVCDFFVISKRVYEEKISDLSLEFTKKAYEIIWERERGMNECLSLYSFAARSKCRNTKLNWLLGK